MGSVLFQMVPFSSLYFSSSVGPVQCLVNDNYRVLICCTCHFQSQSLFLFILASSVCRSPQCLISALTQGGEGGHTYLGSFVQLCCGEGGTLQINITGVCWECSQCMDHIGFAPAHGAYAFLVYTAQAPGCSARELSKVGPGFRALSRSKLLRFRFSGTIQRYYTDSVGYAFCALPKSSSSGNQVLFKGTVLGGLCMLISSPVPAVWFPGAP